jgi:hypothetical protein
MKFLKRLFEKVELTPEENRAWLAGSLGAGTMERLERFVDDKIRGALKPLDEQQRLKR